MLLPLYEGAMISVLNLKRRFEQMTGQNSAVVLLIGAAAGALLFMLVAGAFVYANTRSLITSGEWVQHTEDVLATLQRVSLLVERIEYRSRLYVLTGNEEQLSRARASGNQLDTTLAHLKVLVNDSEEQTTRLQNLNACSRYLNQTLSSFTAKSELSSDQIQECQKAIGFMNDREQFLLQTPISPISIKNLSNFCTCIKTNLSVLF